MITITLFSPSYKFKKVIYVFIEKYERKQTLETPNKKFAKLVYMKRAKNKNYHHQVKIVLYLTGRVAGNQTVQVVQVSLKYHFHFTSFLQNISIGYSSTNIHTTFDQHIQKYNENEFMYVKYSPSTNTYHIPTICTRITRSSKNRSPLQLDTTKIKTIN